MILNIIISILVGLFVLTLLRLFVETITSLVTKIPIESHYWIVPAIFAMAIYFCSHL